LSGGTFEKEFFMASSPDWFPHGAEARKKFISNFCLKLAAHADEWHVSAADASKLALLKSEYDATQAVIADPDTRNAVTVNLAKVAFDELEKQIRYIKRVYIDPGFESGVISRADYLGLGLTPHDHTHTPVADPTSRPQLYDVKELGGFAVRIHFKDEYSDHSQSILPGCNGCLVNYHFGPEKIDDVEQLKQTQLFTSSPVILQLPPEAEGAWLSIVPRWQLKKEGILGPWGVIQHVRVT
jgi:hypothetical protein